MLYLGGFWFSSLIAGIFPFGRGDFIQAQTPKIPMGVHYLEGGALFWGGSVIREVVYVP